MDYSELIREINSQNWEKAGQEIKKLQEDTLDDTAAVLAATVCLHEGKSEEAYDYICRGLARNDRNAELYLLLGNYYEDKNVNQAWLCYEHAEFYCDHIADKEMIRQYKSHLESMDGWSVKNVSIVILSYNLKDICIQCIDSIRKNNAPGSMELIVVDNASSDGIVEWLRQQEDIVCIFNQSNKGFPYGCNQGIKAAEPDNDILLLNNDTEVLPHSIFWLRMGLYSEGRIGAAGSVSNCAANWQMIDETFQTIEEYRAHGRTMNLPLKNACEKKTWLMGFAMLIRREALDGTGLLDIRFTPGGYEDNDISIRLQQNGWQLALCHNSFIFHYGSGVGKNRDFWSSYGGANAGKLREKWGFDLLYYTRCRTDLIGYIREPKDAVIRVLEIGCGCGDTLSKIAYLWPRAEVRGVERNEAAAKTGANYLNIIQGDIETLVLPYEKGYFDYIILGDVLECFAHPQETIEKMIPCLRENGKFLCSVSNIIHESVLLSMLKGNFSYADTGILDRSHIRFYSLTSIAELFYKCRLRIEQVQASVEHCEKTAEEAELLEAFYRLPHIAKKEFFQAGRYVFTAVKR